MRATPIAIVVALASTLALSAQTMGEPVWGGANGGLLSIGISRTSSTEPSEHVGLEISLRNVGQKDFVVNLGVMLANGKAMFPNAIRLLDLEPTGRSRELHFKEPSFVAGRVDDFIVALRSGATYTFTTSTDQYWSPSTKEFALKWVPGVHRISARFEGRAASHPNLDTAGVKLLNFWVGTVNSGVVQFAAR